MRVLMLVPQYPPILGGAQLQAQRLARMLQSRGVRVSILTQRVRGEDFEDFDQGVHVIRGLSGVAIGPLWGATYMYSTHRWLRRLAGRWEVLHNQQVDLHSWVSMRVAAHLKRPLLLRFACSGRGGDLATLQGRRFGPRLVASLCDAGRLVALTAEGASEIVRYGLPAARVTTIPNGIDLRGFNVLTWPEVTRSEPLRLLFVGRLSHQKGLDTLLHAMTLLKPDGHVQLRIVGEGAERARLQTQVALAGLESAVDFRGSLSDVTPEYAWSEVVVMPSRFEGMPNVALEAMSSGRPVLGTGVGGLVELIEPGRTGWLVASADPQGLARCLAEIRGRRPELRAMGLQGRKRVEEQYSLERVASMYLAEYERLLAAPVADRPNAN